MAYIWEYPPPPLRVFVITSGQIKLGTRLALILHAADQDLVLLPSLWLILPVVFLYWDFNMITSLHVSGVQIGECGVTSRCFSCTHLLALSSKHATRWQTITPPPRPRPRKYSVVRRNPKLQLELSSKRSLKRKCSALWAKKKGICSFSVINHKWSPKVNKRQRADRKPYFTVAESAGGLNSVA